MNGTDADPPQPATCTPRAPLREERRFVGIPVSPGIAIGPVFGTHEKPVQVAMHRIQAADIEAEGARLEAAILQSRKQLTKLRARLAVLPEESQEEIAPLLDAYLRMLGPSRLTRGARRRIAETLVSAETAVVQEVEAIGQAFLALTDDDQAGLQRRAEEVGEIGRRIVRNLTRAPFRSFAGLPKGAVLVAEGLRPADAALLDPARLAAVATDEGGSDGHTSVMLRALGVPAVLGAAGLTAAIRDGDVAVVDGLAGTVVLNPTPPTLLHARRGANAFVRGVQRLTRLRHLPPETVDHELVELQANLELPAELPLIAQAGATGIGLLRSEFLFMNREGLPDEDAQTATYRAVIEAMDGGCVTIRVLDWGGEKDIEAAGGGGRGAGGGRHQPGAGPARHPPAAAPAGIIRDPARGDPARRHGRPDPHILLPMVTTVGEVRAAREVYAHVVRRLRRKRVRLPDRLPPMGIMIETPGAALSADGLAREAEFFAIGTNDLTMYTLAVDRGETDIAHLYDPLHPAVLRLVQFTVEAARRAAMPVSVCGEMAANPEYTPLLLGLGLRSFSMNAAAVPRVKQAVRLVAMQDCNELAQEVMGLADTARIRAMVAEFAARHVRAPAG